MKFIQTLILCNIVFISACGGSDSPSGNVSVPAIDGPKQALEVNEDSFITAEGSNNKVTDIEAPVDHNFTAAKQQQITITSQGKDSCHINIYTRYNKAGGDKFAPSAGSRVVQVYSEQCEYSGAVFLLNQQRKLLIEVINLNIEDTTSYYEKTVQNSPIELAIN